MKISVLIGYFAKQGEAREALKKLRHKGFGRAALLSKGEDGKVRARRSIFGVDRKLIKYHARLLASGETVLILQEPIEKMRVPFELFLEIGEIPPALFVLHQQIKGPKLENVSPGGTSLNLSQLLEHAKSLAADHQLDPKPVKNIELLRHLEEGRKWVQWACLNLSEAGHLQQSVSPAAEWLLDNEYILESTARDIRLNLPRNFYRQLPSLANGPERGLPRIYGLARELVSHTDMRLDEENVLAFIETYQSEKTLSIGELWAVPQMLRAVLLEGIGQLAERAVSDLRERELADLWANRLITVTRRKPHQLFSIMAELSESEPNPSPCFAAQLIDYLYDEGTALVPVQGWLERTFHRTLNELTIRETNRQTKDQLSIGNAFISLRQLSLLDWKKCFETLSKVDQTLRHDPANIYSKMDFATRDMYRRAIEDLHRGSGLSEEEVAKQAVEMASEASFGPGRDELSGHVGTYLIGDRRGNLAKRVGCREALRFRFLHWAYRHHTAVYLIGISIFTAACFFFSFRFGLNAHLIWAQLLIAALLVIPASQIALETVNYLITRIFPPRTLPKMDFKVSGIPDACKTLVVVPMMLTDLETVREEAEKLEVRYLANTDNNLLFGLYSDFTDADKDHVETDAPLLHAARKGIEFLNQRYEGGRFFLFHRERKWCASEGKFIGWERKRGKLEELNRLIDGTRAPDVDPLVYVGDQDRLANIRYVITLDSDTQLPHDTARRMIETLSHPLNVARMHGTGRVRSGYSIIQPRVSPSLPSTSGAPFSRLFSDPVGIDPYTNAVSDVSQDLAGEGSYHGKGIYDVRTFSKVLSGRFPEDLLLSHDLIEGSHVRVGLASDIELYDEFPQDYLSYVKRQHRWVRGDWQIADWILPRVPKAGGGRHANVLTWFDRWKVLDNLRRSWLPATSLGFLIASWFISSQAGWIATAVVAVQLFFHSLAQPVTWATTGQGIKGVSFAKKVYDMLRVLVEAALLPYQAWLSFDATMRVFYRRCISHRRLLEWTSAQAAHGIVQAKVPVFILSLVLISSLSVFVGWALLQFRPESFQAALPWLILWFISPLFGWLLNRRPKVEQPQFMLPAEDRQFMRDVARRTWRYFTDFVNDDTSWLPPDNYQVAYQDKLAMRTSPTNIGLYLVSVLGAKDFGYVTLDDVVFKLSKTMESIAKLERYEGHLLNWYDIKTLEPLSPRYVSMVDSGNLLGSLWSMDQGLIDLIQSPLLGPQAFEGLKDAVHVLQQVIRDEKQTGFNFQVMRELMQAWKYPPDTAVGLLSLLRRTEKETGDLFKRAFDAAAPNKKIIYWIKQVEDQLVAWKNIADRYLTWIEILSEKTEGEISILDPYAVPAFRAAVQNVPSLKDIASGQIPCIASLAFIRTIAPAGDAALRDWIDRVVNAFEKSKWLANEKLDHSIILMHSVRDLSGSINMNFLYNTDRRLFSIGYNVSEGRLDRAFYDLLASEARLGSFVAIARGDIPTDHWFSMSRPYGAIGRRRVLLSWTGTMFEYLMPLLFQRSYANSLLDKSTREAVAIQMAYGSKHHVPWGISECAYGDLDIHKTHQYAAFGVPELGLKRDLAERMVVAPYATMLALNIAPQAAVKNLKRFSELGLLNDYGYYEAIDFSQQPSREGEHGVAVRTYMAHHQGMSFMALTNLLHDNSLQRHFHSDPRVRAAESLLHERIPNTPPLHHISTRERVSSVASIGDVTPAVSQFDTPHTSSPKTQLLSNSRYSLMVTNAGGGYSRWNNIEITRWRSDKTRDPWGTFCYIRDVDSNQLWCNTYQPTVGKVSDYGANFTLDRAMFRRFDHGIESETEVVVAPEDDVEIRRITLINRTMRTRRLDLTSYVELSMSTHDADIKHPAFNKLFIETEALPEEHVLLAHRRPRLSDEAPVFVAHRLTFDGEQNEDLRFETDRRRFIGRGRTIASPMGASQEPGRSQGFVLDPVLSLRKSVVLHPGKRVQVSMVLAAGESREHALSLTAKYGDVHAIDHALDLAWASAQLELRLLRIQPDDARSFQQLASHLLYPGSLLRSTSERISQNRKGQSGLWAYSISGDLPILLVAVSEARDLGLVRQLLQAHTYWRMHGLMADLVILNEEAAGYTQPLREQLEHLVQSHTAVTGVDKPGGVFLRSADIIAPEDLTLLRAVASVVMVVARGTLQQQLSAPLKAPDMPENIVLRRASKDPSAALPFMDLPFFNSVGGFTTDGREYAVYLAPGINTPAPWVNVIANPNFGTLVSETGSGFTWAGNSQRNRLTPWSNDPVTDPPSEAIYIRDEDTGVFWTPTASPIREKTAYRARHGAGYSVYEHNSHGIEQELIVFVPVNDDGGEPIKLQRLTLKNDTARTRKISVTHYAEWTLGEIRESSQSHIVTDWDSDTNILTARNFYNPDYGDKVAFAALSMNAASYTGDRTAFMGRNRSMEDPAAMERKRLSRRTGAGLDPCAALQVTLKLAPGEQVEITCMLGEANSVDEAQELVFAYRDDLHFSDSLEETKDWWNNRLGTIEIHTPELATDIMINRWTLYQNLSCRIWGRSAFYQSSGAFGFRDQLQDVMALLYSYPDLARSHILYVASRQFKEGDVQHWWQPLSGEGIRSRISDDLLWLPFVAAQYVRVTGDTGILNEIVPYLDAPLLKEDQHETIQKPVISSESGTLFEHCERAVKRGQRFGSHGLPLMGTGDWNDGMNLVGAQGKGESVWLAWFMAEVLSRMSEMAVVLKRPELGSAYIKEREAIIEHVEKSAWDGEWYLRAFFDDGSPLGSATSDEAKIDSIAQSWAILSGGGDKVRTAKALESAWNRLVSEEKGLAMLLEPPFDKAVPSPGYIKGYPPGIRENGGQYTHAALWLAMAMARSGDGTRAYKILRLLNPIEHAHDPDMVWRYGLEPYVVAADVYAAQGWMGHGGWSWYTGSASWMYRVWVEEILGLKVRGETLQIDPVIPGEWDGFKMTYRHGDAVYDIEVLNPERCEKGVAFMELDGKRIKNGVIGLSRELIKHRVVVKMGKGVV
ncbi:MAG: glycosyl transferase [Deltaproteobacteria bacterium CG11_big_fil_rev_8_21_14_0_20_49_13]|nr:MAG: glycosyl transferase [Deltaproteobacteria bacterium CG11_big_fil_rev_8_21_14_0_20_49_13]